VTLQASQSDVSVQTRTPGRDRGLVFGLLGLAALLGVLLPLALSGVTGSLSIPHNDTWAFSRSAQIFAHTGEFHLFNWNDMALVGTFVPLGPLASSIAVQQVYVAVLALVGLAAFFDLARGVAGPRRAAFGTVLAALWPGYGLMGTSLMTDIPAFAAVCVCLTLGRRAYLRGSLPLLLCSTLAGLWGTTTREQAAAAPAVILGVALLDRHLRARFGTRRLIAIILGLLVLAGGFELWRRGLAGGGAPPFTHMGRPSIASIGGTCVECWLTVALPLSPAVLLAARVRGWAPWVRIAAAAVLCVLVAAVLTGHGFLGNYLEPGGAYQEAYLGPHVLFIPSAAYDVLLAIACVSGALLAGLVLSRIRRLPRELMLFGVLTVLGTGFEVVQGHVVYDRYLLPLAVALVPLVLLDPLRCETAGPLYAARRVAGGFAAVVVAGAMTLLGANALAFDSANGMQDTTDPDIAPGIPGADGYLGVDDPCYVITAHRQSVPGWTLEGTWAYRTYAVGGPERTLRIYRTAAATCR
jgi:hypothetical protein